MINNQIIFSGSKADTIQYLNTNFSLLTNKPNNPNVGDRWILENEKGQPGAFSWSEQLNSLNLSGSIRNLVYKECIAPNVSSSLWIKVKLTE
jgi:hypothetical protein